MTELRIDLMPLKFTHCLSKFMRNGSLAIDPLITNQKLNSMLRN
jgi:hypothetical protein